MSTGVILRITPHIYDESIGIELQQELSDAIQTETGVKGSPTITRRSIQTRLNLHSGQWVVLDGVSSSNDSATRDGIPFFKSLSPGRTKALTSSDIVIVLYVEKSWREREWGACGAPFLRLSINGLHVPLRQKTPFGAFS